MGTLVLYWTGSDKLVANLVNSPVSFGLSLLFILSLFYALPVALLLQFKTIRLTPTAVQVNFVFRPRSIEIPYHALGAVKKRKAYAKGITFTELSIEPKIGRKITVTTRSNTNVLALGKTLKRLMNEAAKQNVHT